jgi:hypothetical protein
MSRMEAPFETIRGKEWEGRRKNVTKRQPGIHANSRHPTITHIMFLHFFKNP